MMEVVLTRPAVRYPQKYDEFHRALNSAFAGYVQKGTEVTLLYSIPLTECEQADIISADINYVDMDLLAHIRANILIPARSFGQDLIDHLASENIALGITQMGQTNRVRKIMREVTDCLMTGSLLDAITEARAIPSEQYDTIFVTEARILKAINMIEDFLKKPRSTSL